MTKAIDDGGPAFPKPDCNEAHYQSGMSLLDYFAGQALANSAICHSQCLAENNGRVAYQAAITMLNERERLLNGNEVAK